MENQATSEASETDKQPVAGDLVFHDGKDDFIVKRLELRGEKIILVFENERFKVECDADDLRWGDLKDAWYLPGRLYPKGERLSMRSSGIDVLEYEQKIMGGISHGGLSVQHRKR